MLATGALGRVADFAAFSDGTLLDAATWQNRHRRLTALCWLLTLAALTIAIRQHEDRVEAISVVLLATSSFAATIRPLARRARELAVALVFVVAQLFANRYVGNTSGLGAVFVILLSFYQDWVPIAFALSAGAMTVVLAALEPELGAGWRGFAAQAPLTGTALRFVALAAAGGLATAVWRSGTQLARDHLTGAFSRAGAERMLEREIARGRRPAVWVCEVDNVRSVNETLGFAAGDELLRQVACRVRRAAATLPSPPICARLGGDAFLIAMATNPGDAVVEAFAHEVGRRVTAGETLIVDGQEIPVRLAVGATSLVTGERAGRLIYRAECAAERAKGQGDCRVVFERPRQHVPRRLRLLSPELERACRQGELELHYQPIVSLATGQPVGAESLVRWNHPERGQLFPGVFIPEAEKDSALMALVSQTLGEQFRDHLTDWAARRGDDWLDYGFAYNLSAVRLQDPTLLASMAELLESAGRAHPEWRVTLEVTEGALMSISDEAPMLLHELRAQGYRVALDDFGTGPSSLAHLRDFPVDVIKLDRSYVQNLRRSPVDGAIIQAVADIAAATGVDIVAEGVETEWQRRTLLSIKHDMHAQGWLYAPAMLPAEFEAWVDARRAEAARSA